MNRADSSGFEQNDAGTSAQSGTHLTQPRSRTVRYEIVGKDGRVFGWNITFDTAAKAAEYAKVLWLDQEQDEERAGKGWDIQVVGVHRDEP
jgi:hypothetical protein